MKFNIQNVQFEGPFYVKSKIWILNGY